MSRASWLRSGVLQLTVGSVLISFSGVFVKLVDVGPTVSGFYRNLFGAAALLILVIARRTSLWRGWTPMAFALLAGLLFAADIFVWHRSILHIGPGLATILGNFQVFLLATFGVLVLKEHVTGRFVMSVLLAFVGLTLLVGVQWNDVGTTFRLGVGLGLATALVYAAYLITLRGAQRARVRLDGTAMMTIVSVVCAALLGLSAAAEGESLGVPNARSWMMLIAYGVICQGIGWLLIARAIPRVEAARAGLILLLQPTLTFIWDILFFQRPTTRIEALGALVALAAIYLGSTAFARGKPEAGSASP